MKNNLSAPARLTTCVVVALSAAILGLTSCTASPPETKPAPTSSAHGDGLGASPNETGDVAPEGNFQDIDAAAREYREASPGLQPHMPEGASLSELKPEEWDPNGRYEEGYGEIQAAFEVQCAWAAEYRAAVQGGDSSATDRSLQALDDWADLPEVVAHVDSESRATWHTQVIAEARAGNDNLLLEATSGC